MHKGRKSLLEITVWQIQSYLSHRIPHISSARLSNLRCFQYNIYYTGRFIIFSVITNICNKKTKGPTLTELFTATGKLEKHFLTTRDVRCVHHGWHGTHRYDIQVLAARVHMGASILFTAAMIRAFRSARSRGNDGANTLHEMQIPPEAAKRPATDKY